MVRNEEKVNNMVSGIDPAKRALLEGAALNCPVHKSIHPDVQAPVKFIYPD